MKDIFVPNCVNRLKININSRTVKFKKTGILIHISDFDTKLIFGRRLCFNHWHHNYVSQNIPKPLGIRAIVPMSDKTNMAEWALLSCKLFVMIPCPQVKWNRGHSGSPNFTCKINTFFISFSVLSHVHSLKNVNYYYEIVWLLVNAYVRNWIDNSLNIDMNHLIFVVLDYKNTNGS